MRSAALARALGRMLPAHARDNLFEPAWHDLQVAHLTWAQTPRSPLHGAWKSVTLVLGILLLYFDCWRLTLAELPVRQPAPRTHRAPKERIAMLMYYLRHAARRLWREPGFTLAAALTLALGVGANVSVFAIVEAVLLRPLPYAAADRLVILNNRDLRTGITKPFIAIGDYIDIGERQTAFEQVAAYGTFASNVYDGPEPYRVVGLSAAPGLLRLLHIQPALGRAFEPGDGAAGGAPVAMLGYELWQQKFGGDSSVIGRSVRMGQVTRTIVGVTPPGFRFPPTATTEVVFPMVLPAQAPAQRKSGWTFAVARLKPGQSVESATASLTVVSKQLEKEFPKENLASTYYAESLRDALVGNTKQAILLLLGAVVVVLLIACANVANLLLARSLTRRREMAVRLALGAGRRRLATLLVSENLMLVIASSAVGIAFAFWGARALISLVPGAAAIPGLTDVHVNGVVLGFALAVAVLTALAFAAIATFTVRLDQASDVLVAAGRATMTAMARRATAGLVVAEVALAIVLLVGAGLILRSFAGLLGVDPGFKYDRVMTMNIGIPAAAYQDSMTRATFYQHAFVAMRGVPGVEAAGAAAVTPLTGNNWTVPFERPEHPVPPGERAPDVGWQVASTGFFTALQIPLKSGRYFDDTDRPDTRHVVIISEALEKRFFPGESAIGKFMGRGPQAAEIVGVVGDIRRAGLRDAPRQDSYAPAEQQPGTQTTLFVRTAGDPIAVVKAVQAAIKTVEPNAAFGTAQTLSDIAAHSILEVKLVLWLLGVFAVTALALAAVGIYGVMSYVVRQRSREIGTRMALGATKRDVLVMVMRQGGMIAVLGTAIGLAGGLAVTRSLQSLLFGVKSYDPATLALSAVLLVVTVMAACYLPARRAASVDPARTLTEQ